MGGWARRSLNVTPSGRVLPCHAAETIPGLEFWSVRDMPSRRSGATRRRFRHFAAPTGCRSLVAPASKREIDFGGCRCQAMAITGDAPATDPACELSPHHARMRRLPRRIAGSGGRLCVSRPERDAPGYSHSSSLKAVVALRAL